MKKFSHINPRCMETEEVLKLIAGDIVKTKQFGRIRMMTKKELKENPPPEVEKEFEKFLTVVWL